MRVDNNIDARIAAARAMGLSDTMAKDIQIIKGVPEYRPDRKPLVQKPEVDPKSCYLIRYDGQA